MALSLGSTPLRTRPRFCPSRRAAAMPSYQPLKTFSKRLRNPSSSGDISCARLLIGQPRRSHSGLVEVDRTIRARASMGFFACSKGRSHLSRTNGGENLIDHRVSQRFFVFEVMVECSLG